MTPSIRSLTAVCDRQIARARETIGDGGTWYNELAVITEREYLEVLMESDDVFGSVGRVVRGLRPVAYSFCGEVEAVEATADELPSLDIKGLAERGKFRALVQYGRAVSGERCTKAFRIYEDGTIVEWTNEFGWMQKTFPEKW